jgi:uncharacterized protein YyaL (SSP411 family)
MIRAALDQTLAWSRAQGYLEHTKHDALGSPLIWALCGHHKVTRILATQLIMRSPVDVRTLLGVPKSHNPKGLALFVMALLDAYAWSGESQYLEEAERLLELLLSLRSPGDWQGDCWGYQYPWQDLGFFAPKATPNAVVTAFVCEAFLQAYRVTGNAAYLKPVEGACRFFLGDLTVLKSTADEMCIAYMPLAMNMRVMDVSILVAAVLAQYSRLTNDTQMADTAMRLARYVARQQTAEGAWFYTDPPGDSPVKIDNYHTGFILDAFERVMSALEVEDWREQHRKGLDFYARHLFNPDGSPRWMSHVDYPHDIHGAAQGILTFSLPDNRQRYPALAGHIVDWGMGKMYHPDGRFYYQETRFFIKKQTYIRWCNAWMCRALSRYLLFFAQSPAIRAVDN